MKSPVLLALLSYVLLALQPAPAAAQTPTAAAAPSVAAEPATPSETQLSQSELKWLSERRERMEQERARAVVLNDSARRSTAERQRTAGKWLIGFGVPTFIIGLGVMIPDILIAAQGRSNDTPTFFAAGSPFVVIGALLVGIGAPLYVIGNNTLKALGPPPAQLSVKPMLSPGLYGMSLSGSF